jgi:hypothetical protein
MRISWKKFIEEIEKCVLLVKEKCWVESVTQIKSIKLKNWCKYMMSQERNIDIRCRINWYERKDYKKGFFMDRTLKLLALINESNGE